MLRLPENFKRYLTDAIMLALCTWALILPVLQIFFFRHEIFFSLLVTCLLSLVLTAVPLLKNKFRGIVYLLMAALLGLWMYQVQLPAAAAQILKGLIARQQVNHIITLYADLFIPTAIVGITLYIRLLIQGEPSFSAPLLLSNALMLWFSGARQGIADFLPAMMAVPLLYVYSNYLQDKGPALSSHSKSRSFLSAVPIALLIAVLAFAFTPGFRQTNPTLEKKADQLRQLINDYFFFTDSRENFSLSSLGYQPMGDKGLGGKPDISNIPVMEVETGKKVYLRGSILNLYNGRMWYDSVSNERYGYASLRFSALRDSLLDAGLPEVSLRAEALPIDISLLNPQPSTLFVPQRLRSLSLSEGMVPYLNAASELFITRNLQAGDHYELSYEPYIAGTKETDALADRLMSEEDSRYESLMEIYTQLPVHLQPNGQVTSLARQITGGETDPYRKALLIRDYLKKNFTYTLEVVPAPEDLDFASHFLFQTKQGYCTYFATAMTVLARTQGLPSRYIEGFIASPGTDGLPTVLTGQQAHAWTEIYIPALGWITFDATATTGELPAPQEEPESSPPDEGDPEQTPEPEENPDPEPSQEPEDQNDGRQDKPSPKPSQEPENSPPPEEEPLPEVGAKNSKVWLWLLLLIALIALIVWRIRETQPHRRVQKLQDNSKKLLIYWQALSLAMLHSGKPMLTSETIRDYAGRTAPGDAGLFKLSDAVSGVLYGKYKAGDTEVTTASLYYQSAYAALSPLGRVKLIGKRLWLDLVKHINKVGQFMYTPVQVVLKSLCRRISQSWSDFKKKLNKLIKKR